MRLIRGLTSLVIAEMRLMKPLTSLVSPEMSLISPLTSLVSPLTSLISPFMSLVIPGMKLRPTPFRLIPMAIRRPGLALARSFARVFDREMEKI